MARTAAAVALTTIPERVSVLEIRVEGIDEKIDELKVDVKDLHDCLDRTRDGIMEQLNTMHKSSCDQHTELAGKITSLEKQKQKFMTYGMVGMAFIAGLGFTGQISIHTLFKFFGL